MARAKATAEQALLLEEPAEVGFRMEYNEDSGGHLYWCNGVGPLPGATSITALQEAVFGSDRLVNWAYKLAVTTAIDVYTETQDAERARGAAWTAKRAAVRLGSAVHNAVEHMNKGEAMELTPEIAPYVAHYGAFALQHGVKVVAVEQMIANISLRYGGKFDLLAEVDDILTLVDVKTGKPRDSYRLQLTGYEMAELRGDEGQEPVPMPKVARVCALYLSPDGYDAHF